MSALLLLLVVFLPFIGTWFSLSGLSLQELATIFLRILISYSVLVGVWIIFLGFMQIKENYD